MNQSVIIINIKPLYEILNEINNNFSYKLVHLNAKEFIYMVEAGMPEKECIQCLSCQIVFNDKNTVCINKKIKASIRKKIL